MATDKEQSRIEFDTMGNLKIPAWAYWGAQTQRALHNFTVSDLRIPAALLKALVLIKYACALVNRDLKIIDTKIASAISKACAEILEGKWHEHFPVDVFQTGSGTSWNMNANEVIANRANELLGYPLGKKQPVHPNDHVNRGQSSNDVIPSATNISNRLEAEKLINALTKLDHSLAKKAVEFKKVIKPGRTHLQDAVPISLGQEFSAYQSQIKKGIERIKKVFPNLEELALGGTALGTGINTHPQFGNKAVQVISRYTGTKFKEAVNKFEAIASRDTQVELMGVLNTLACSLMKIANDIRLLASGPRAGLAEIRLKPLQPGSSIMPGKINPVIPEVVIQVAAHIMGKAQAVTVAGQTGPLDLQIMQTLIAYETLSALDLLTNTVNLFNELCIQGIEANEEQCARLVEWSLAMATPLAVKIGYDKAANIALQALNENKTVKQVAIEQKVLTLAELDELLNPQNMLRPSS